MLADRTEAKRIARIRLAKQLRQRAFHRFLRSIEGASLDCVPNPELYDRPHFGQTVGSPHRPCRLSGHEGASPEEPWFG